MKLIQRLVVFSIFMENNEGIAGKAPDYIMEKWILVNMNVSDEYIIAGMDMENQAKFRNWQMMWGPIYEKEAKANYDYR